MPDRACAWHDCLDVRESVYEREKKEMACKLVEASKSICSGLSQVFTIDALPCFNHISVTKTCIKEPVHLAWTEQRIWLSSPGRWGVGGYSAASSGAGPDPALLAVLRQSWLPALASALNSFTPIWAQICGSCSHSVSALKKKRNGICRGKTGSRRGEQSSYLLS